ncbi:reverse transcriptase [Gossypium australe]|uniref:Reverse transcriptase n=1 Tax=Gossypium australe TaxID=47621 RepID=A0A5B6W692_9ROSI|nr:reverse transcriptase [Gossypium australe]
MGFVGNWVDLILKCITLASYMVNVNGNRGESFQATRGGLKGAKASKSGAAITHILFADDCTLFGEATRKGASLVKGILKEYGNCLGQCVNFDKSSVFFSTNTAQENKEEVLGILGVRASTNMERYLGLPSLVGRRKKESFQALKEKVLFRIKGWCNRFLSQGSKEVFIKSVLQAIPTYAMSCFLLPKSFCGDLEKVIARSWWQKSSEKKGIHWCQWQNLCCPKEEGGMGFRSLAKFNLALLEKQGWRIVNNPDSLVAQVLKAKYFPNANFINSCLGNNCSFTWKSIWAAKCMLMDEISILDDAWILDLQNFRLSFHVNNLSDFKVVDLIDDSSRKWKSEELESTFPDYIAEKILRIPLAKEPDNDVMAWSGEPSGEFTVRSAYKLLHHKKIDPRAYALQIVYKKFYKKLWMLNLPSKIKIIAWKISWNYISTRVNMHHRRLSNIQVCPRCGAGAEDTNHLFRECPEWLTWVFEQSTPSQCRLFCCALWAIWGERNRGVHERIYRSAEETSKFIRNYILKLDEVEIATKRKKDLIEVRRWKPPPKQFVKINFDAAFDSISHRAAVGIVARDREGIVL